MKLTCAALEGASADLFWARGFGGSGIFSRDIALLASGLSITGLEYMNPTGIVQNRANLRSGRLRLFLVNTTGSSSASALSPNDSNATFLVIAVSGLTNLSIRLPTFSPLSFG